MTLNQCPTYSAVFPAGKGDGSLRQELEVILAPLTITPSALLQGFVLACHCTVSRLVLVPRERALLSGYTVRIPSNFKLQLLPTCSRVSPGDFPAVVCTPLPNLDGK